MNIAITAGAAGIAASAYGNAASTGTTVRAPQPAPTATATAEAPVVAPSVAPAVPNKAAEAAQAQNTAKAEDTARKPGAMASKPKDAVTITYDALAGVNVFKAFDTKGNLVLQVPPAQLLKTMELEGKNAEETKGQLINTKI
jgi:hypothetical protein